ncbi:hypothetical protein GCM10028820_18320 [Tessaracoccus terricola]
MSRQPNGAFRATVARIEKLSENFTRITFAGDELRHFGSAGFDQRIKLLFPLADGSWTDFGLFSGEGVAHWYSAWRQLPDEQRNAMRTYTVRAARPDAGEIDVDFVLHGTDGPASAWASGVCEGDEIIIIGPDARAEGAAGGMEWHPGTANRVLIAGDETAVPAICAIVESLGEGVSGEVFLEVPATADVLPLETEADLHIEWLARDGAAHGTLLTPAVEQWGRERIARREAADVEVEMDPDALLWDSPGEANRDAYAWLAGEAGVITGLRRHLVRDLGLDRSSVAFMGYWRAGRAEN